MRTNFAPGADVIFPPLGLIICVVLRAAAQHAPKPALGVNITSSTAFNNKQARVVQNTARNKITNTQRSKKPLKFQRGPLFLRRVFLNAAETQLGNNFIMCIK